MIARVPSTTSAVPRNPGAPGAAGPRTAVPGANGALTTPYVGGNAFLRAPDVPGVNRVPPEARRGVALEAKKAQLLAQAPRTTPSVLGQMFAAAADARSRAMRAAGGGAY